MRVNVAAAVRPGSPFLRDPGGQAGGRVVEAVAEGLRLGRLDGAVATLCFRPPLILVDEPRARQPTAAVPPDRCTATPPGCSDEFRASGRGDPGPYRWRLRRRSRRPGRHTSRSRARASAHAIGVPSIGSSPRCGPVVRRTRSRAVTESRRRTPARRCHGPAGRVSSGTSGRNSANELGQPCVRINGIPPGRTALSCTKWIARAVDVGAEVMEFVQPALLRTPVELACPVVEQPLQIGLGQCPDPMPCPVRRRASGWRGSATADPTARPRRSRSTSARCPSRSPNSLAYRKRPHAPDADLVEHAGRPKREAITVLQWMILHSRSPTLRRCSIP